ncbi:MAG: DNA adenine methylase [Bacteroidota bacterium]
MIKSPLRYPGGKSRAIDKISYLIPNFDEYREPFVGGGSVFINLKQKYPKRKFWINDIYNELFQFWLMSRDNLDGLLEQVIEWRNKFENGKDLHRFLVENISSFDSLKKASAFFVFNRITFSGTTESGGFSEQAFNGRFTLSSIDRLKQLKFIIPGTEITNSDYQPVVEAEGENVFIFLDPPYYSAIKSALYGKNGNLHKIFDHVRFSETMKNCKHKWLVTYDDSSYIRDLFSFANIINWDLMYGMRNQTPSSNQKGRELFIANYSISLPEQEQLRLVMEPKIKYK